jgi:transposase-like protein
MSDAISKVSPLGKAEGPKQPKYSREFKLAAAKLVTEQGYSAKKAGKELGVSDRSIRDWVEAFQKSGDLCQQTSQEKLADEVKRLRVENARLKLEKDILKKAAKFFVSESP